MIILLSILLAPAVVWGWAVTILWVQDYFGFDD